MGLRLSDLKKSEEQQNKEIEKLKERMSRMVEVRIQQLNPDSFYLVAVPEDMDEDQISRLTALLHGAGLTGTVVSGEVRVIQIG